MGYLDSLISSARGGQLRPEADARGTGRPAARPESFASTPQLLERGGNQSAYNATTGRACPVNRKRPRA